MLASVQQSNFYLHYSFALSICKIRRSLLNSVLLYKNLTECTRRGRYTQWLKIYYMNEFFSMLKNRHRNWFWTPITFCSQQPSRCVPNIQLFSRMYRRARTKKNAPKPGDIRCRNHNKKILIIWLTITHVLKMVLRVNK
jgi:hypothetical protein